MILGFIVTVWYSALLGSFLTTFIREPQIRYFAEFKKSNLKILFPSVGNLNTSNRFRDIEYLIVKLPRKEEVRCYRERFNRYIDIVKDTGLYEFWKSRYFKETFNFTSKEFSMLSKKSKNTIEDHRRILDVNYFLGPFILLLVGSIIATFVFIFEILKNILNKNVHL